MTEITAHHGLLKDTNLHVDDTGGTGRPVVLIHGWPLSGESWSKQVPAFEAAGYRVITYDRRGFGRSDKPLTGYDYDTFASDLDAVLTELDLVDVTLVGFSMGGGEIARYIGTRGEARLHSVVFASAVPPYLEKTDDNPDDEFTTGFYSANGVLKVTEAERQEAIALAHQSKKHAALASMAAFATTDFRDDLTKVTVPTLVIHGDSDATVPFEGSGARTHQAIAGSELHVVKDAPHGVTVSHPEEWNQAVLEFLKK
jgi:pimeloyl-ACP methyl ester carboxylesterase